MVSQNNYNSSMNVGWSWSTITNAYNDNEKVWNIATITKMWHRDKKWANAVGKKKMMPIDLLDAGLPQTSNLQKIKINKIK